VMAEQNADDGGWILELKMAEQDLKRFMKRENLAPELLETLPLGRVAAAASVE